MEKKGFFEDQPGRKSSVRLVFVTGVWSVLAMAGYYVYKLVPPFEVGTFLGLAITALSGAKIYGAKKRTTLTDKPTQQE